ncbi:MAG: hypothetical protein ACLQG5_07690 [Methanobacterium sp.]
MISTSKALFRLVINFKLGINNFKSVKIPPSRPIHSLKFLNLKYKKVTSSDKINITATSIWKTGSTNKNKIIRIEKEPQFDSLVLDFKNKNKKNGINKKVIPSGVTYAVEPMKTGKIVNTVTINAISFLTVIDRIKIKMEIMKNTVKNSGIKNMIVLGLTWPNTDSE